MKTTKFFITLMFLGVSFLMHAQESVAEKVKDWERAKAYTLEYMEAMPADKYDFKPTGQVRSFAEQILHITDANYGFASVATGAESPIARGESEQTEDTSKENVIKLVNAGYDYVIDNLKSMTDDQLKESIKVFGQFEMTRGTALDKAFEHQTHHRGQTTIYLRLSGVKPPSEKLF
jgi:uncharacterized damage-inducible protein DinB